MWQCRNRALVANEAHKKGVRWEVFPFFLARFGEKKGSRIKMGMTFAINGGLLCASH